MLSATEFLRNAQHQLGIARAGSAVLIEPIAKAPDWTYDRSSQRWHR